MLTITTIITYRPPQPPAPKLKLTKYQRVKAQRAIWAAQGLCQQHGNERPCRQCADATKRWRDGKASKAKK